MKKPRHGAPEQVIYIVPTTRAQACATQIQINLHDHEDGDVILGP